MNAKSVAMATSLLELEKRGPDRENSRKYLSYGENRASRCWDIFGRFKKEEEITEGKIYSPVGKFAERAKQANKQDQTDSHKNLLLLDELVILLLLFTTFL